MDIVNASSVNIHVSNAQGYLLALVACKATSITINAGACALIHTTITMRHLCVLYARPNLVTVCYALQPTALDAPREQCCIMANV